MNFDTNKLETTFIYPATNITPIMGRKYTLTHSDTTGTLFLDIGITHNLYAIDQELRDEVLGKLELIEEKLYILYLYVFIGDYDFNTSLKRYNIFKSHLSMSIEAIVYGDSYIFDIYPDLINSPIYVKFDSIYPQFNNYEFYGYIKDFR